MTTNRFQKLLGEDPDAAERITAFLAAIQHTTMQGLNIAETLDAAGTLPMQPPQPPMQPGMQGASGQALPGTPAPGGMPGQPAAPGVSPPVPTQM